MGGPKRSDADFSHWVYNSKRLQAREALHYQECAIAPSAHDRISVGDVDACVECKNKTPLRAAMGPRQRRRLKCHGRYTPLVRRDLHRRAWIVVCTASTTDSSQRAGAKQTRWPGSALLLAPEMSVLRPQHGNPDHDCAERPRQSARHHHRRFLPRCPFISIVR
jgi:hypothetical protein